MTAILAVLIAAVMVTGVTASAEAINKKKYCMICIDYTFENDLADVVELNLNENDNKAAMCGDNYNQYVFKGGKKYRGVTFTQN